MSITISAKLVNRVYKLFFGIDALSLSLSLSLSLCFDKSNNILKYYF